MKPLRSSTNRTAIAIALLLAAGCSLTADVKPTHQLQWVPADPPTTQPAAEPQP